MQQFFKRPCHSTGRLLNNWQSLMSPLLFVRNLCSGININIELLTNNRSKIHIKLFTRNQLHNPILKPVGFFYGIF